MSVQHISPIMKNLNADIDKLKKSIKDNDARIANIRNDVSTVDIKIKELVKKKNTGPNEFHKAHSTNNTPGPTT